MSGLSIDGCLSVDSIVVTCMYTFITICTLLYIDPIVVDRLSEVAAHASGPCSRARSVRQAQ